MPTKNEKTWIITAGSICAALTAIIVFWTTVDSKLDSRIRMVAKSQIEIQNTIRDEKLEVLYRFTMYGAKQNRKTAEVWDEIVNEVRAEKRKEIPLLNK